MSESKEQQTKPQKIHYHRQPRNSRMRSSESEGDGSCVVCAHVIEIYAIGYCDHHICFKCSMKMRILCSEKFCPVCRKDLIKVMFTKHKKPFAELNKLKLIKDHRYNVNIFFDDPTIVKEFHKVMEHRCPVCKNRPPDPTFNDTKTHLRKDHSMFYCEICLEHIKNFTSEYKAYSRKDLATHKRVGDAAIADDTSHRGHPLCEFCEERYLDNDNLFLHLRKDHYYCHICDRADSNDFYADYKSLYDHFKKDHFVCVLENCANEEFTNVFATELDIKAHKASVHKGNKTKQQQKQDRQIDLGFQYSKRDSQVRGRGRGSHNDHPRRNKKSKEDHASAFEREGDLQRALTLSLEEAKKSTNDKASEHHQETDISEVSTAKPSVFNQSDDFPALNNEQPFPSSSESAHPTGSLLLWTSGPSHSKSALKKEEFPSLSAGSSESQHGSMQSHSASWSGRSNTVNHGYGEEEFPSLGGGGGGRNLSSSAAPWGKASKNKPKVKQNQIRKYTKTDGTKSNGGAKSQLKASDFLKTSVSTDVAKPITSKKFTSKRDEEEDDFPTLNPVNSLLVGRGSHKHIESHTSFAGESQSNVKMISSDQMKERNCDKSAHVNKNVKLNFEDDFPSLNLTKKVSAPPGFEKKLPKSSKVVKKLTASQDLAFPAPKMDPSSDVKKINVERQVSSKTNASRSNAAKGAQFSMTDVDFPGLPESSRKPVRFTESPNNAKLKSAAEVKQCTANPKTDESLQTSENPAAKPGESQEQKGFKTRNRDKDFPSLMRSRVAAPPGFHVSNGTPKSKTVVKSEQTNPLPSNGATLNLANVFDFPSL